MRYKNRMLFESRAGSLLIASILTIFLLASCNSGNGKQAGRTGGGGGNRGLIPVEALIVQPQLLQDKIITTGTLLANEEVELRSEISGRVTGVSFTEGGRVKKGQLLVKINDRELKAQLTQKDVAEKQASDEEQRARKLYDIKGISQEEYDKILNALQMVKAQKEALESQLAETEITAPFDGIVGLRHISEGGYVTPDMSIATMQEIDPMKVEFSVPEKYSGQIKDGTEIVILIGGSTEEHRGKVYAVESQIDLDTRTIKARAKIPNSQENLIPGSFAKVEITLSEQANAIVIPSEAIVPEINGEKVYVCVNGKANAIPVKTGIRTETGVEITEGLAPNDTLIVSGLLQLATGKGVQIKSLKAN
jgi:membrane fusion protein, multidrug efflux system